ncbi:hypothetical protein ACIQZO_05055 [Streptomyces sp. NPDC097617]|uniref:hypothetical protein n=1 Tax=Streptomyces sp. NPDC097617 TaxID=3366091 RepID=UPI0037FE953D
MSPSGLYVIPGGSTTVTGRLTDPPAIGRRAVAATVTATVPGGATKTFRSNPVRLMWFPWLGAGITAGVLLALVAVLVLTRKRWQASLRRRRAERAAVRTLRRRLRSDDAGRAP